MVNLTKTSIYVGILGSLASVVALVIPGPASSQSTSGNNSPAISGGGNTINYQSYGGFPSAETIRAQRLNISEEQYQAIQQGMTYDQVLGVVKIPGKEAANSDNLKIYTWGSEVYIYLMVTFVNGKVHSKSR